jgi:hypothetical protein
MVLNRQTHTGAQLAAQLTALAMTRDVSLATLQRAAAVAGHKPHIELV